MEWKDLIGYENLYEINIEGQVRNKNTGKLKTNFISKGHKDISVALNKNGITNSVKVKHLLFENFGIDYVDTSDFEGEEWRDIIGFEGVYKISNKGRVKSLDRYIMQRDANGIPRKRFIKGRVLSLNRSNGNGYLMCQLSEGMDIVAEGNRYLHELVATHFIPNPENKPTVNHIDANKKNNYVENLEWATHSEQAIHVMENNLRENNNYEKMNKELAKEIYDLAHCGLYTCTDIGKMKNVKRTIVASIKNKKSWNIIHKQ